MGGILEAPSAQYRLKRQIYVVASILMLVIALAGFWPTYFSSLVGLTADASAVVHIHAAIYVGWLALFICQALLAATGNVRRHQKLGQFGFGYGVLIIVMGLVVTLYQYAGRIADVGLEESLAFPTWPVVDMILFTPFLALAYVYRKKPEIHKRLMIVATTTLLVAAAVRMPLPWPLFLVVWFSPIFLGMAYDLLRKRLIHPVYVIGLAVLFISSFRDYLTGTDFWLSFTRWLGTSLV